MLFGKKKEEEFNLDVIDKPTDLPSFPEIEEPKVAQPTVPQPQPVVKKPTKVEEKPIEVTGLETARPHMYIKIEKYKEVLDNIEELKKLIKELEEDNASLTKINSEERSKVDELKNAIKRAKDLVDFFSSTFVEIKE